MLIGSLVFSCVCYLFGSETKCVHLVIFISPSSEGLCGGTRKLLGVRLSHHAPNIEFSIPLIAYLLLSLKIAAGVCLVRAQVNTLGSLNPLQPSAQSSDFHNSFENGVDITDISRPCLSQQPSESASRFNFP